MTLDLSKLAQRRAALESKLAHATAALRDAERRSDTRRKVVAGAALLAAVREGVVPSGTLAVLVGRMTERDAALFADVATGSVAESEGAQS
ncbi:hypothetical protein [Aureimonas sp. N4]|uniref:hypothetical protein n=1 Tax=Aureimonas sp. N4 TaxID=1638165 RepID=UPI000780CC02|nr:hypothetical protein [Aureimonas sp. N4]